MKNRVRFVSFGAAALVIGVLAYSWQDLRPSLKLSPSLSAEPDSAVQDASRSQSKVSPEIRMAVEKSLDGVINGKDLKASLSEAEYEALREELKTTDSTYLEKQILAQDQKLKSFRKLYYKVLKRGEEKLAYEKMLKDAEMIQAAAEKLNSIPSEFDRKNQVERMIYVDFMSEAIAASASDPSSLIHSDIQEIILSDIIFDANQSRELRQSMYVDRLEIFRSYARSNKNAARTLADKVKESKYKGYLEDILVKAES